MEKTKKILGWTVIVLFILYVIAFIVRTPFIIQNKRTTAQVEKIHATKLQLSDVMGDNLPPDPGAEADKTIAGIDANQNGIRDDVELAVFKEYPDSAKTRAVLLQYALALQMEVIQPIINQDTVTEVIREQSRAYDCVSKILPRVSLNQYMKEGDTLISFVKERQLNIQERIDQRNHFLEYIGSYTELDGCDIDYSTLPN